MNGMQGIVLWLTQNSLAAAALFFGGAALAVTLYTYVHDSVLLTNPD